MAPVYINIHVPKNAGQTFTSILRRRFGPSMLRAPDTRYGQILSEDEKLSFLRQQPRVRCVTGHTLRYPVPPLPGRRYRYLTFLREPIERLVSLYAFEKKLEAGTQHASQGPIEEWIEIRLTHDNALTNYQAFHVQGARHPAEVSLEAARRCLEDYFFTGITERFDDSLLLLARRARFSLHDLAYRSVNVTGSKTRVPISPRVRQRLVDLNPIDLALYEWACQRFDRQLAHALSPRRLAAWRADFDAIQKAGPKHLPAHYRLWRWLRQ